MYMICSTRYAAAAMLYALLDCSLDRGDVFCISKFHHDDPVTTFTITRHPPPAQQCELVVLLHDLPDILIERGVTE
jgi:hypothetical protein